MRPVNLIPPEDRRGDRAPLRAGSLSYVVVGALAAALIGVTAFVLTGNSVTDKQSELDALEAEQETLAAEAQALAPYAEFASLQTARETTVTTLAESRFDWERVLREIAIVNPKDVFLLELTGTAGGEVQDSVAQTLAEPGTPALTMLGCSIAQDAVARMLASMEDIDGVTRVGLSSSVLTEDLDSECSRRGLPFAFEATVAFDNAAAAAVAAEAAEAVAPETATPTADTGEGVADAQAQEQEARDSAAEQSSKARDAAEIVPGVAR